MKKSFYLSIIFLFSLPSFIFADEIQPGLMPWTDNMPKMPYTPDINDIFANFYVNWTTLTPVLAVLFGTLFGFFILKIIKRVYGG